MDRKFYYCTVCGNLVELIEEGGGELVCCGQPMEEVKPNTTDAAQEKHVPVLARTGNQLEVNVGSADHPMLGEHYITFIDAVQEGRVQRARLNPGDKPHASFTVADGPVAVYAWCNLHGLWSAKG